MVRVAYAVADSVVHVSSNTAEVHVFLDILFARATTKDVDGSWVLTCVVDGAAQCQKPLPMNVAFDCDSRTVHIKAATAWSAAYYAQNLIRELFVASAESRRFTMLHASAACHGDTVLIFVGPKNAGKTTLVLDSVLSHGFRLIANDYLVVSRDDDVYRIETLPSLIVTKRDTSDRFAGLLPPQDARELAALDTSGDRRYFAFRQIGGEHHPICRFDERSRAWIVLPKFYSLPRVQWCVSAEACTRKLAASVRTDWLYNDIDNPPVLPRARRAVGDFLQDTATLCAHLVARSRCVIYEHEGSVRPLLDAISHGCDPDSSRSLAIFDRSTR
jgi:hypothetical protein